jgi:hypothetical protein
MAGSTDALAALLLAAVTSGCVSGHLLEAGRRWERAKVFEAASRDGERLIVRYRARVTDDAGSPLGEGPRRAIVAVESLRGEGVTADQVTVAQVPDTGALPGRPLAIERAEPADPGAPAALVVRDDAEALAPIPANVFTTTSTAAWVYPLMPLALVVDATSLPVLLFFSPGMIVIGD